MAEAFAKLHNSDYSPDYLKLSRYDALFTEITQGHQKIFESLKRRRQKLQSEALPPARIAAQDAEQHRDPVVAPDQGMNFDFLLGALDAASGQGPSSFALWYAGPDYYRGYVVESAVELGVRVAADVVPAIAEGAGRLVSLLDTGLSDVATACCDSSSGGCKCDEDCCKGACCGGGAAGKALAAGGGGGAVVGNYNDYAGPATQTATTHPAGFSGLFSSAPWNNFFAPTIGTVVTAIYAFFAGLPALYNFTHSLFSKLIRGGERNATASRDRWAAAQDLTFSTFFGGTLFFLSLALLGPHAAISFLILGMLSGNYLSKRIRKGRERDNMGGISKPDKWVPDSKRIEQLTIGQQAEMGLESKKTLAIEAEQEVAETQPGASSQQKYNMIQRLLANKRAEAKRNSPPATEEKMHTTYDIQKEEKAAKQANDEMLCLEAVSNISNSCYRIGEQEKKSGQARTDWYSASFYSYQKSKHRKNAVKHAQALNEESKQVVPATLGSTVIKEADQFIKRYTKEKESEREQKNMRRQGRG